MSDSKLWVNYNSRVIIYLKELYAICNPKVPKNPSKWSYVQEQSDSVLQIRIVLDVKCNNLSFGDPNWMILIGEETLEP